MTYPAALVVLLIFFTGATTAGAMFGLVFGWLLGDRDRRIAILRKLRTNWAEEWSFIQLDGPGLK